ncbi:major facilitator transporter, partial [Arthrobacter crystallopoietes BAB-32]
MTVELKPAPLLSKTYRATTAGIFALAFLSAFEAIAVATVMPVVARDLDGLALYAIAFSTPLAVLVVATAMAGGWIDARGP